MIATYDELGTETAIETEETFIAENPLGAIETVLVHKLTDDSRSLVLHADFEE